MPTSLQNKISVFFIDLHEGSVRIFSWFLFFLVMLVMILPLLFPSWKPFHLQKNLRI